MVGDQLEGVPQQVLSQGIDYSFYDKDFFFYGRIGGVSGEQLATQRIRCFSPLVSCNSTVPSLASEAST